ncbi:MAG: DNA recombination protein RmuC [Planctomycetota bacterium]
MEIALGVLAGLALGVLVGLAWAQRRERAARAEWEEERADLEAHLSAAQLEERTAAATLEAHRQSAAEARRSEEERLREIQGLLAPPLKEALQHSTEHLATRAQEREAAHDKALREMLKPFQEQLEKLQKGAQELEVKREGAYGALKQQLDGLQAATKSFGDQSSKLLTALRGDIRSRGRWGEVALRNLAEFAGMTRHCDFSEQQGLESGNRPDMVVRLPDGKSFIPVDSKVPMDAYMRSLECEEPAQRAVELAKHARDLRTAVDDLAKRNYAGQGGSPMGYTVLFVAADPLLAAAFESDPELQTDAMRKRVLIATPVTMLALLSTVALYWQQSSVAENAQRAWETAREFHKRVSVFAEHLAGVGKGLTTAINNYNKAVGSWDRSVLPQGQKLEELEAPGQGHNPLPELPAVEGEARVPRLLENEA